MDLLKVNNLFEEYNTLESRFRENRIATEIKQFENFQMIFHPFNLRMKGLLKKETPYYNIFDILNVRHRETKLHTPFLVNLLDPKASHQQDSLFLDSFLSQLMNLEIKYSDMTSFEIYEEHSNDKGQIDILIKFFIDGKQKALVIENKIYAGDQDDQLTRYYDYLLNDLDLTEENIWLVYLTPSGKMPSETSMLVEKQMDLRKHHRLIEIGYHKEVVPWLTHCNLHVKSIRVKQTLFQYTKTLENL